MCSRKEYPTVSCAPPPHILPPTQSIYPHNQPQQMTFSTLVISILPVKLDNRATMSLGALHTHSLISIYTHFPPTMRERSLHSSLPHLHGPNCLVAYTLTANGAETLFTSCWQTQTERTSPRYASLCGADSLGQCTLASLTPHTIYMLKKTPHSNLLTGCGSIL